MQKWSLDRINLELKYDWRVARSSCIKKVNFFVTMSDSEYKGQGEIAFNTRYGESEESIQKGFEEFTQAVPSALESLEQLLGILDELNLTGSVRFGIESAFMHYLSDLSERPVCELLGVEKISSVTTDYTLPLMDIGEIGDFIKKYNLTRFNILNLKISHEESVERINEVFKFFSGKVSLDANESWSSPDDVINFMEQLKNRPIEYLEQPLKASLYEEQLYLKKHSTIDLFADESLIDQTVNEFYSDRFDGVNVKLMKCGGYIRAIKQLRDAINLGMNTKIGCMVESSLGISSAMNIADLADYIDLDSFLYLESNPLDLLFEENGRLIISSLH